MPHTATTHSTCLLQKQQGGNRHVLGKIRGDPCIHVTCNSVRVAYCKHVVVDAPAYPPLVLLLDGRGHDAHVLPAPAPLRALDKSRAARINNNTTITLVHPHGETECVNRGNYLCSSIYLGQDGFKCFNSMRGIMMPSTLFRVRVT